MFQIALFEPQIAPNTGNIIRLVANNGCRLHLIEPLGFNLEDKQLRRAGLDYHDLSNVVRHSNYANFLQYVDGCRIFAITTKGKRHYDKVEYETNDIFLFGSETSGLPDDILLNIDPLKRIRLPMLTNNRSMNLSNVVAIVSYEAWRQHGFAGGE